MPPPFVTVAEDAGGGTTLAIPAIPHGEAAFWVACSLLAFVGFAWTALKFGWVVMGQHFETANQRILRLEDVVMDQNKRLENAAATSAKAVEVSAKAVEVATRMMDVMDKPQRRRPG